jgi:hypothetical protein
MWLMSSYLVCEGPAGGLDDRVLSLIVAQKLGKDVQVIPAGGEKSLGSVANWLAERSRKRPDGTLGNPRDRAYIVEDRDFCSLEEAEQTWTQLNQKRWMWRRHEVENYLLDPRLVANAFRALREASVRGAERLPDDEQTIFSLLQRLAQPMLENHAGWLTYWQLVFHKRDTADTRLLWPDPSLQPLPASLYPGRIEWLDYLRTECVRLREACRQLVGDMTFDEPAIAEVYDRILSQVTRPDFLTSGQFLIDLGGHELVSVLCVYVNHVGVTQLSCDDLITELLSALDRLYQPGFFNPDDFSQLADELI